MFIPSDYVERVYAGVLGKIIGVYLGRPFEGWSYEAILAQLGEINYYVHERRNVPLIVTDDDIAGTFTFLRALPDHGHSRDLTPAQIGQTWLNYIIEKRSILWWGGLGNSTEHTAYLRMKAGIPAPDSGSARLNGKVVSEQIGAQIFVDGWAMVAPGDPELAADLARRAGSVSHDGEALYGAQALAAMEAAAFVEPDTQTLLDIALRFVPGDSVIYRLIQDLRAWHAAERDWHKTREKIVSVYGYDTYGGNCHMVPNHALIILGLLYGENDFQRSLMITNTSGWDTDCNSGNLGCLLGIKHGLAGLETGPDWRGPVADRLYLSSADGGRAITDAVIETYHIANLGLGLAGEKPVAPKGGARFHFEMPGSVQGFQAEASVESQGTVTLQNVAGHSARGQRSLAITFDALATGRVGRVSTSTFIPPEAIQMPAPYDFQASPTLYPGQTVRARLTGDEANAASVQTRLYVSTYGPSDHPARIYGPAQSLAPGGAHTLEWRLPDTAGAPIFEIGLEVSAAQRASGTVYLDYLTWEGTPTAVFQRPNGTGQMWRRAWVNGVDHYDEHWPEAFRIAQDRGRGLLIQGCREWQDYQVQAVIKPHLMQAGGLAVCVQGLNRYYALLLCAEGKARLEKWLEQRTILAEVDFAWDMGADYAFSLSVQGGRIRGWIDGHPLFDVHDPEPSLRSGAIALVCEEGRLATERVSVSPWPAQLPQTSHKE
jgi:ADP-ribosylglycohydrolase